MIQDLTTGSTPVMVAAIGATTSVLLALITGGVTIWNNKIARRAELTANRTEHTVNSKTTALETEIQALKSALLAAGVLGASKDATIAAQQTPASFPLPVVVVDAAKPLPVHVVTPPNTGTQ